MKHLGKTPMSLTEPTGKSFCAKVNYLQVMCLSLLRDKQETQRNPGCVGTYLHRAKHAHSKQDFKMDVLHFRIRIELCVNDLQS